MPKVEPYGTPTMKGVAMADRLEEKRVAQLKEELKVAQIRLGAKNQEQMSEMLGISFSRYKRMLEELGNIRLSEIWQMMEVAKQLGISIDFMMTEMK